MQQQQTHGTKQTQKAQSSQINAAQQQVTEPHSLSRFQEHLTPGASKDGKSDAGVLFSYVQH